MRVILPTNLKQRQKKRRSRMLQIIFTIFTICLVFTGSYFYQTASNYYLDGPQQEIKTSLEPVRKEFRIFNGEELKVLYNNFHYTNTYKIISPPPITGNTEADKKIRTMAEARGYRLRRLARDTLGDGDGHPLQLLAQKPWQDLKASAAKDGIVLTITWAFRSIEDQRAIFLAGLGEVGATTQDIADGKVDGLVDKVLQTYAPPGYSRHHTGFTIDLTCGTNGLTNFAKTSCYEWISKDNYLNAKTFGWIPSYPEGANLQGPEPEPWEYIWVTSDALLK